MDSFGVRVVGAVLNHHRKRSISNRGNEDVVGTDRTASAGANHHNVLTAYRAAGHNKNSLRAGGELRVGRDDLTRRGVDRNARRLVVGLRDRIVRTSGIADCAGGGDGSRLHYRRADDVLIFVRYANRFCISHVCTLILVFKSKTSAAQFAALGTFHPIIMTGRTHNATN